MFNVDNICVIYQLNFATCLYMRITLYMGFADGAILSTVSVISLILERITRGHGDPAVLSSLLEIALT